MTNASLFINQGTNAAINFDSAGGTNTQVIAIGYGTVSTIGTLPNIPGGSIIVTAGTLTGGTLQNLVSGTINSATVTLNSGTINVGTFVMPSGTITSLPNLPQGSINVTAGTIATLGTLGTLGLVNTVTTVSNLSAGSVNVVAGTIATLGTMGTIGLVNTVTTLSNLSAGSVNVIAGTIATLGTMGTLGLVNTVTSVTGLASGTINLGTFVANGGTIAQLTNGSIVQTAGTMNTGTLSPIPTIANVTFGTHGTTGVTIFGTLAGGTGSGAGTEIFITSLSLTIPSTGGSQDASIGWGTNAGTFQAGTGLLVRGNFPPGGGIQKTYSPPVNSGTNAQLCLFQAGAGTVDVSVTYFITPSTL